MRDPEGIARALRAAESIAVCSHINPDGDTIGSALAMRLMLQGMCKRVRVFCRDKVPDNLAFLPGAEEIRVPDGAEEHFDLLLSVDASDEARLDTCWTVLKERSAHTAQIDHHGTNPLFMEVNSVDGNAAATCVMIREQLRHMGVPLTREIAMCLYAGISTDTGNFSFDCTDAETFRAMADLMGTDLPLSDMNYRLFREKSRPHLRLLGRAISSLRYRGPEDRIAVMTLTRKDFEACGATSEHADTIVNYGMESTGTRMSLLGREDEDGKIKFSLRAVAPFSVDEIAARLGGGGHSRAAGISMEGALEETTERVVTEMIRELEKERI